MTGFFRTLLAMIAATLLCAPAQAFDTSAKAAFVVDITTGSVLLDKNADEPRPPASMSKLMTLYVAFEAIKSGRLSMEEKLPVSQHAMSYGGSTMFLDTTDKVTVKDLILGIIVLSGNDACAVIAEALSPDGTEAGFAKYMTQRAHQMGMTNSSFANSNGWPAEGHLMSTRDLALLARHLITDFPEYYPMFAVTEFKFDGRAPQNIHNRNPLLKLGIGADGLKTGHTERAGYGLVGSAQQGDRRIVFVISGLASSQSRAEESAAIVNWAFRQFTEKKMATAGTELTKAPVWMGNQKEVGLTTKEDLNILVPVLSDKNLKAEIVYESPLEAPIKAGDPVAVLHIAPEGLPATEIPLVATSDVPRGGFVARLRTVSGILMGHVVNSIKGEPPATSTPEGESSDSEAKPEGAT